jgi:cephalosporin hydroxylase
LGDQGGGELCDTKARTKMGLWPAIADFLRKHEVCRPLLYFTNNNGLTVLERGTSDARAGIPAMTDQKAVEAFHRAYYSSERTWKQTYWLGVPALKCVLDLWIYQEILFETRPDVVIETGTWWGGSALFFASIFDLLGAGRTITIDVQPQPGRPTHQRITYLTGSSISAEIVTEVGKLIEPHETVMVVLDSDHSASHVLQEMRTYKRLVSPGGYLVVEDTNVNGNPVLPDFGPGPREAVEEFLKKEVDFVQDRTREKFGLTFCPGGFLRRSR